MKVFKTLAGEEFWVNSEQEAALKSLENIKAGGFAHVSGYRPDSDWIERPTVNLRLLTAFSIPKLYERRIEALQAVEFSRIQPLLASNPKLAVLANAEEVFDTRKDYLISTLRKSLSIWDAIGGEDATDAHRLAHIRNYVRIGRGVKVNLQTEKVDGLQIPKKFDGLPLCEAIMLNVIELGRTYVVPGVRKVTNSGAPVLMGKLIEDQLSKTSKTLQIRAISLKPDNFTELAVSNQRISSDDIDLLRELEMLEVLCS